MDKKFNNIGKRDILIFPKFQNLYLIQEIRKKYDRLANLVDPHITLAFPFSDNIRNEDLIQSLNNVVSAFEPFKIIFSGISLTENNTIFLNCIEGKDKIIELHDKIYENILPTHLKKSINYIPHITLGICDNIDFLQNFDYKFETIVNEISIEQIGENEESIILKNIKL